MKKLIVYMVLPAFLLSSCGTGRLSGGDPGAVMAGAYIGGSVGSAIGGIVGDNNHGWRGGYRGSAIGSIVGTIAGAAIGNAISASRQKEEQPPQLQQPIVSVPDLKIRNIRFIDDNRNHVIDAGESSKIVFEVVNEGRTTINDIVPSVVEVSGMKHIYISPPVMIEQIAPGEGIRYTATISAGSKLKQGEVIFRVAVAAGDFTEVDWQEFSLPTQR